MRKLVVGDTHGNYLGLMQALERACFMPTVDQLIVLGDTMDGWSDMDKILDYYIDLKYKRDESVVYILGNHDLAFLIWAKHMKKGGHLMYGHGGMVTEHVYLNRAYESVEEHYDFLHRGLQYLHDKENNIFYSHAGWNPKYPAFSMEQLATQEYQWSRDFMQGMYEGKNYAKEFTKVFLGHTPTYSLDPKLGAIPLIRRNVFDIDTGAGFYKGKVTVMNVDTLEYWQSDTSRELYPIEVGRGR